MKHVLATLEQVEGLLFGGSRRERPLMTYEIKEGSVRHLLTTALQTVIGFNAILQAVQTQGDLDFLQPDTARALEYFQGEARQHDFRIAITTSLAGASTLVIDATTHYERTAVTRVEAEFYFYGRITDMGGSTRPNIHLQTAAAGTVILQATKKELKRIEGNPLYDRDYGVRATGQQDVRTGEVNRNNLHFVEMIDYESRYDEQYLATLRRKATRNNWPPDADAWLRESRGYAE